MYAVEYAGFINLNDEPFYEGKNCLDFEDVGENVAKANAKLIESAPELLCVLQDTLSAIDQFTRGDIGAQEYFEDEVNQANKLIKQILG